MQTKLRQGLGLDALGPWHYKGLTSKNLIKVKTKEATKKCHGSKKHITQDAGWLPEGEGKGRKGDARKKGKGKEGKTIPLWWV